MTDDPPTFDEDFRGRLRELFAWRRDVRRFRTDPLPAGALRELIGAACLAPSVGLSQPWRFVIVESPGRRAAIVEDFERCNREALDAYEADRATLYARLKLAGLKEAPAQLAVFADEATSAGHGLGRRTMPEMLRYSVVTAIANLWLAARAAGIGMGWVSILDPERVREILDVPPSWRLIGYFCLGYPETESATPELETEGWERRHADEDFVVVR
ncbi:MAG TPA: 5,6-dimethylbenzimidazole synthase [Caulobacteraceae bacterium]|nr:5,6-dimethylbenzimidazole synthase [Caulobacteraceae bacterium]